MAKYSEIIALMDGAFSEEEQIKVNTAHTLENLWKKGKITEDQFDYFVINFEEIMNDIELEVTDGYEKFQDLIEDVEDEDMDAIDNLLDLQAEHVHGVISAVLLHRLASAYSEGVNIELVEKLLKDDSISSLQIFNAMREDVPSDRQIRNIRTSYTLTENVKLGNLKSLEQAALELYSEKEGV